MSINWPNYYVGKKERVEIDTTTYNSSTFAHDNLLVPGLKKGIYKVTPLEGNQQQVVQSGATNVPGVAICSMRLIGTDSFFALAVNISGCLYVNRPNEGVRTHLLLEEI